MAGTNRKNKGYISDLAIILKGPQLAENIGMVARTMLNFGLYDLRLIKPKQSWKNIKAINASAGAIDLIKKNIKVYSSTEESTQDIEFLCATTVRDRDMQGQTISPSSAINQINTKHIKKKIGFLFGAEKAGLSNEDISHANLQIKIPTNSVFGSLNLAMAVNIICYECFIKEPSMISKTSFNLYSLANKKELNFFKNRLIEILKETNFLSVKDNHEKLIINVKNIFSKSLLSNKDLKILHGIITHLKNYENK